MAIKDKDICIEEKSEIFSDLYHARYLYRNAIFSEFSNETRFIGSLFDSNIQYGLCRIFCNWTEYFMQYIYDKKTDKYWYPTPSSLHFTFNFKKISIHADIPTLIKKECLIPRLKVVNNLIENLKSFDNE